MRKTLLGLMLAVTSALPAMAAAQDGPRDGRWRGERGARQDQPRPQQQQQDGGWSGQRGDRTQGAGGRQDGRWQRRAESDQDRPAFNDARPQQFGGGQRQGQGGWQRDGQRDGQRDWQRGQQADRHFDGRGDMRDGRGYTQGGNTQWQRGYADRRDDARDQSRFAERGQWNRGWRGNERYDYGGYRNANRGAFRLPRYYAPSGWNGGYRRFSVGIRLSSGLFGQNYWIDDPYDYRLPPAYGPYRWVRYYNDALLVDVRSGYVVDTVYDIFW